MNSIERITAAVNFEIPDRPPVIPQVFGHAAVLAGVPLDKYVQDGELLAKCQIKALERYNYDAVFALMDANVETEAAGSVLSYRENQYPHVKSHILAKGENPDTLILPDPYKAGRMPELLKAVTLLRNEVGNDTLVVGCIIGPMTLAIQLLGAEQALFLAIDEEEKFGRLLDYSTEVILRFGEAQIKAGAHLPIVFDPSASPAVVPKQFFREFILPRYKKLFSGLKAAGAAANWLHIAGPVEPILPFYSEAGVDIGNFDYCVDPLQVQKNVTDRCLDGNVKSFYFVDDNQDLIGAESAALLDTFSDRGGFILSSGCEIPPESKPENITAMVLAAHKGR